MKHFILPIALGLALVSCNRDNDNNSGNEETPILPVKIVKTGSEDGDLEMELKYNGNKLIEIIYIYKDTEESRKSVVGYTGDFITSIIYYHNNKKKAETIYKYENEKLIEKIEKEIDSRGKEHSWINNYTYNSDGTITNKYGDAKRQYTGIITMTNGNIVKIVGHNGYTTITYTYDTKNNPFKNVKGMSPFVLNQVYTGAFNNVLEIDNGNYTDKTTFTYQYKNNFPTKQVMKYGNDTETTTYTYNK